MLIDPEEARAARQKSAEGTAAPQQAAWSYAFPDQLHRRWLALHVAEHWTFERIAEFDRVAVQVVRQAVTALLEDEAEQHRLKIEHRRRDQGGPSEPLMQVQTLPRQVAAASSR